MNSYNNGVVEIQWILLRDTRPVDIKHADKVSEGRIHTNVRNSDNIIQPLFQGYGLFIIHSRLHSLTFHTKKNGFVSVLVDGLGRKGIDQQGRITTEESITESFKLAISSTNFNLHRKKSHEVSGVGTKTVTFLERIGDLFPYSIRQENTVKCISSFITFSIHSWCSTENSSVDSTGSSSEEESSTCKPANTHE